MAVLGIAGVTEATGVPLTNCGVAAATNGVSKCKAFEEAGTKKAVAVVVVVVRSK